MPALLRQEVIVAKNASPVGRIRVEDWQNFANSVVFITSEIASGGVAHFLDTHTSYASGKILSLRNVGSEIFYVDYAGNISIAGALTVGDQATTRSNLGLGSAATQASSTFATASHAHAGGDITSGTMDGDRFPALSATKRGGVPMTGVASGKFLRDDDSWAAVPAPDLSLYALISSLGSAAFVATTAFDAAGVAAGLVANYLPLAGGTMTGDLIVPDVYAQYDVVIQGGDVRLGSARRIKWHTSGYAAAADLFLDRLAAGSLGVSGVWNNALTTFTAFTVNPTDTASASASLLADFQVGGVSKFSVNKKGGLAVTGSGGTGEALLSLINGGITFAWYNEGGYSQFGTTTNHPFLFFTNNAARWTIAAAGHFLAYTDNTYDIGASGATRPRTGYFGTSLIVGNTTNLVTIAGAANPTFTASGASSDVGLTFVPKGNGVFNFGGGAWTFATPASGAGSIVLNNGTIDSPNLKFMYGNATNFSMDVWSAIFRIIIDADEVTGFQPLNITRTMLIRTGSDGVFCWTPDVGGANGTHDTSLYRSAAGLVGTQRLTLTGNGTVVTSLPALTVNQTWNDALVTFVGELHNFTSTASASASLLSDWQLGGVSVFKIGKTKVTNSSELIFNTVSAPPDGGLSIFGRSYGNHGSTSMISIKCYAEVVGFGANPPVDAYGVWVRDIYLLGWGSDGITAPDLAMGRLGAASLRLGLAPSATPIAQTFTLGESSRPGTDSNIGGANGTIRSGLGTGTGTASSLFFQTPDLVASGSLTQTYTTRLTVATTAITAAVPIIVPSGNAYTPGLKFSASASRGISDNGNSLYFHNGANFQLFLADNLVGLGTSSVLGWSSNSGDISATPDLFLARDAANILAQRNGATSQEFRVYYSTIGPTYTSLSGAGTLYRQGSLTLSAYGWLTIFDGNNGTVYPGNTTNTRDFGTATQTWKTGYFGTSIICPQYQLGNANFQQNVVGGTQWQFLNQQYGGFVFQSSNAGSGGYSMEFRANAALTVSAPFAFTGTWNAGAVTFTGILANFTDTASAAASLLMDLQVGGVSKFSVGKGGLVTAYRFDVTYGGVEATPAYSFGAGNGMSAGYGGLYFSVASNHVTRMTAQGLIVRSNMPIGWSTANSDLQNSGFDTCFARVSAGVIEVNNGTAGTLRDLTLRGLIQTGQTQVSLTKSAMAANLTVVGTDPTYLALDPNGSDRDVTLPATPATGLVYAIRNTGGANTLTIKDSGGSTITTVAFGAKVALLYDGAAWLVW